MKVSCVLCAKLCHFGSRKHRAPASPRPILRGVVPHFLFGLQSDGEPQVDGKCMSCVNSRRKSQRNLTSSPAPVAGLPAMLSCLPPGSIAKM